jgi:hypothetical protein
MQTLEFTEYEMAIVSCAVAMFDSYYHSVLVPDRDKTDEALLHSIESLTSKINVEIRGDCSVIHRLVEKINDANLSAISKFRAIRPDSRQ